MAVPYLFILTIVAVTANVSHYTDFWKDKATVDWRDYRTSAGDPVVAPPQDQGGCGNCYGFAITGVIESHAAIALDKKVVSLSPQYFVDCFDGNGCDGGDISGNLAKVEANQYIPYLKDYPFLGSYKEELCEQKQVGTNPAIRNGMAGYYLVVYSKLSGDVKAIDKALRRGPTIHGMYISNEVAGWTRKDVLVEGGVIDSKCVTVSLGHAWGFVGFTDEYYTIRGSYGLKWADNGYVNYNKEGNYACNFGYQAFSVVVIKRREIEYKIGQGKLKFDSAKEACENLNTAERSGWTLAVIPTRMHQDEVYNLLVAKWGDEKKNDDEYNYVWIGIDTANNPDNMTFVDGTPTFYQPIKNSDGMYAKFLKMAKFRGSRGKWVKEYKSKELRFVCSRYRAEECERKHWPDIDDNTMIVKYSTEDNEIVEGTVMSLECMAGFIPTGTAECKNGKWNNDIHCISEVEPTEPWEPVLLPCGAFDPTSLNIKSLSSLKYSADIVDGKYASGTTVTVAVKRCAKGFKKSADTVTSTCTNGVWSATEEAACEKKKRRKVVVV